MTLRSRRCFIKHTEHTSTTPSEKACLSVTCRRPCPKERGDPLRREHASGQELDVEHSQAESKNQELQANYDRRSVQKLSDNIESQQKKKLTVLKLKNFIDEINNFFMNS